MWIYLADSTYSAGSAGSPSRSNLGFEPSPTVKATLTLKPSCSRAWKTEAFPLLQYGTTYVPLPPKLSACGKEGTKEARSVLISLPPASRSYAKISPLREMEKAWEASEADYFLRTSDSLARYDRASSSWKMFQAFGPAERTLCPDDWPASGMIADGIVYPLSTWERRTLENDGGFWPTATATDAKSSRNATVKDRQVEGHTGTTLTDFVTLFPTPTAQTYGTNLGGSSGRVGTARPSLDQMARQGLWPTPKASEADRSSGSTNVRGNETLSSAAGGSLNPRFVSLLMGYPADWVETSASIRLGLKAIGKAESREPSPPDP